LIASDRNFEEAMIFLKPKSETDHVEIAGAIAVERISAQAIVLLERS
jgi:hypothetical protein